MGKISVSYEQIGNRPGNGAGITTQGGVQMYRYTNTSQPLARRAGSRWNDWKVPQANSHLYGALDKHV